MTEPDWPIPDPKIKRWPRQMTDGDRSWLEIVYVDRRTKKARFRYIWDGGDLEDARRIVTAYEAGGEDVTDYDGQRRRIRVERRNKAGKVTSVTVIHYYLDGSSIEVTTDYSSSPARVTTLPVPK